MAVTPVKISALTAATTLDGTEVAPVVQGGVTVKATMAQIRSPTLDAAVTAAGTNQGTATADPGEDAFQITSGAASTGVVLAASSAGRQRIIYNATTTLKYIYPASGEAFNGGTTNEAIAVPAKSMVVLYAFGTGGYSSSVGSGAGASGGLLLAFGGLGPHRGVGLQTASGTTALNFYDTGVLAIQSSGQILLASSCTLDWRDGGNVVRGRITLNNTNDVVIQPYNGAANTTAHRFVSAASAVNNLVSTSAAAGAEPALSAEGSDTDIDVVLTPKGAGNVRFGAYTSAAAVQEGYIRIKAADGTVYRLLARTDT